MRNEEAPRTFSKEEGSVLTPWVKWAGASLRLSPEAPLPPLPGTPPKGVAVKTRRAARFGFLAELNACGQLPVERHVEIIAALAPALGWPWEGSDGSPFPSPRESWLAGGMDQSIQPLSGWIEWAAATMRLLRKSQDARSFLPVKTVIEPWQDNEWGLWAYEALDRWWQASYLTLSAKPAEAQANQLSFERWTTLVHELDQRLQANPSPMGLPLHWQMAARQVEQCLLSTSRAPLVDLGPIPPIHSEIKVGGKPFRAWMGTAEWAMVRFTRLVNETKSWRADHWQMASSVMERDLHSRGVETTTLMLPFRDGLIKAIHRMETKKANGDTNEAQIKAHLADVDAWWLSVGTRPQPAVATSRSRRL